MVVEVGDGAGDFENFVEAAHGNFGVVGVGGNFGCGFGIGAAELFDGAGANVAVEHRGVLVEALALFLARADNAGLNLG